LQKEAIGQVEPRVGKVGLQLDRFLIRADRVHRRRGGFRRHLPDRVDRGAAGKKRQLRIGERAGGVVGSIAGQPSVTT